VVGGIIFVIAMVLVVPVGVMLAGAAWTVLFGELSSSVEGSVESSAGEPAADAPA
jgi:hypothetical protein